MIVFAHGAALLGLFGPHPAPGRGAGAADRHGFRRRRALPRISLAGGRAATRLLSSDHARG